VTRNGRGPLHYAISSDNIENVRILLSYGAKAASSPTSPTPLELADSMGKSEMVALMKSSIPNVNVNLGNIFLSLRF